MRTKWTGMFLLAVICAATTFGATNDQHIFRADETPEQRAARMKWWREAKFGMFIHWGLYAAAEGKWNGKAFPHMRPGFEWLMCKGQPGGIDPETYVKTLGPKMTLKNYHPEQWAALAKEAGMRYLVITAKHHDGFGMVDFPDTDYDIAGSTPYGKDPMIPLADAVRKAGLHFGFYFSQSQDWSKPGARPDWFKGMEGDWNEYVDKYAVPQLRHLLGGTYGRIDILWFDSGSCTKSQEGARKIWNTLALQPWIIVNNRLKFDHMGDFTCPEQWIPPTVQTNKAWETCMTMNGGWGYNPTDTDWKSTDELIRNLCYVVGRGGNYLLNVGPRADGTWQPEVIERLKGIGAWMRVNSEAIYGTSATPLPPVRWGITTWKPGKEKGTCRLFCHIMDWPKDTALRIPVANRVKSARLIGDNRIKPVWRRDNDSLIVQLNRAKPIHPAVTVLELVLNGKYPQPLPLVIRQEDDGRILLKSPEAECSGGVRVSNFSPDLEGWSAKHPEKAVARWRFRVLQGGRKYRPVAHCGFNAPALPTNMDFVCKVNGKEIRIPLGVTGVEPDAHNPERNRLRRADFVGKGTFSLQPGVYTLELRAEGVPAHFRHPGKKNRKLCYTAFPMMDELRLEPAP